MTKSIKVTLVLLFIPSSKFGLYKFSVYLSLNKALKKESEIERERGRKRERASAINQLLGVNVNQW